MARATVDDELDEEDSSVPANSAGAGGVDGIGVGPKGEPGVYPKKKRLRVLMGMWRRSGA